MENIKITNFGICKNVSIGGVTFEGKETGDCYWLKCNAQREPNIKILKRIGVNNHVVIDILYMTRQNRTAYIPTDRLRKESLYTVLRSLLRGEN